MKVLPIIYRAPMARATWDDWKTQTRRMAYDECGNPTRWLRLYEAWQAGERDVLLYVRETWTAHSLYIHLPPSQLPRRSRIFYRADDSYSPSNTPWRSSIHMPRWASRMTLRVTDVRLQRLHEISEADAKAEGMREPYLADGDPPFTERATVLDRRRQFRNLWNTLHGAGAWAANPPVAAITFEVIRRNVDDVLSEAA